jgi:tripartite ATP-independent transporter DctM subunit
MPLPGVSQALTRIIAPPARWLNGVGAATSLVMVLLVTANVLCRDLFGYSLMATVELEQIMLVVLVFWAMAHAQLNRKHIAVDFFTSRLPQPWRLRLACLTQALGGLFFLLFTWQSLVIAWTYWEKNETTLFLQMSKAPLALVVALGLFLLALALLRDALESSARLREQGEGAVGLSLWGLALALLLVGYGPRWWGWELDPESYQAAWGLALLALLFSGMLIGAGLGYLGMLGMALCFGTDAGLGLLQTVPLATVASYSLCVIPFFILMGEICFHSGLSDKLYRAAYRWVGHWPGGLAIATVLACGAFSAVSGSSLATAATMGTVALPQMRRYGYQDTLATGCIAAGGTIGILIPPSVILIIYGVLVEVPIAELFFAGIVPGLISLFYYVVTILVWTRLRPELGPRAPRFPWDQRLRSLAGTWEVLALFLLVMGGIYGGWFTPTEAGAIGASGALVFGLVRRRISGQNLKSSLLATGRTTAMVFLVVIGTAVFGYFLTSTQIPMCLAEWAAGLPVPPYVVIAAIIACCFVLGCVMGTLPLVFITVPIFAPVVESLGYDLVWFGVVMVVVSEIGLITPPVGMNVFIMKGVAHDVPLSTIFKGILPFLLADLARLITIIAFPPLTLFLPQLLR